MFVKPHDKLVEVLRLQVLESRLIYNHPQMETVINDLRIKLAEVRGEEQLDYPLGFLNNQEYLILHNLRIQDENGFFQIDTLVIYRSYLLILEAKNWYGTLLFDKEGNVIRIGDDGKEEGFPNPIVQVKMQEYRLRKWLHNIGFSDLPIHYFVVISFSSTILKSISPDENIPSNIIHSNKLYLKIRELNQVNEQSLYVHDQLLKLSNILIQAHSPSTANVLLKYKISRDDIQTGVKCPCCQTNIMIRSKQKWHCRLCNYFSKDAHVKALLEYKLLFGNRINIREAGEFLQVESRHTVKRLLQSAGCQNSGGKKGAYYLLDKINETTK
ncbi:nuclease-related domain-containing protein [Ornithinibacillus salinisoli]|uniref:Nuclease-related domain-containing protein n=1 Tax=Ornithinibacillus salinisoli TaxID=1848459 RepID=A0ABW4VXN8_9BACI